MMKIYDFGYILIEVWALVYLVFSFSSQIPWATCNNTWNTGTSSTTEFRFNLSSLRKGQIIV